MASRICFISPSPESTVLYRETLSGLPDPPPIFEGAMKEAHPAALAALREGYDILVTPEHNARHIWDKIDTPIVVIPRTAIDIARAIVRAKKAYGDPLAYFDSLQPYAHMAALREILDYDVKEFVFNGQKDAERKIRQAMREGFHAVIGGAIVAPLARKHGIPCVALLPSPDDLLRTYRQAQQLASVRQVEEREAVKFKQVVQYAFSGIIVTDEKNRIAVFNPAAERIFAIPASQVLGQSLWKVIDRESLPGLDGKAHPQLEVLVTIRKKRLMVNTIPIAEEERILGMILTFHDESNIQSMEEKVRRAGHVGRLAAKHRFHDIIGHSRAIREAVRRAQHFAATDETVLITGDSGTGKEVFAQSIHNMSARRNHPFLAVNCSAIAPTLLESELFGYAEGAFTGAQRGGKQGMFELAHPGTLFLDEIGELSKEAQGHLLRVLQEKEVMRVGGAKVTPVDVRVIAATNRSLEAALRQGLFRWDLYHRLNILPLRLPALCERREDILPLANAFVAQASLPQGMAQRIMATLATEEALVHAYPWPGNVRELQNLLRRIVALCGSAKEGAVEAVVSEQLRESLSPPLTLAPALPAPGANLKEALKGIAATLLDEQEKAFGGSKAELARKLGIGRTTLWRKLKKRESAAS
ncbi:MAG: sigma 54-interacting transcriptional regulator [Deltaproteobacteria bacterium]|nr:sigma 54-interacting transcriptional regulator [Deltaproteobacteria bacterium]